MLTQAFSARNFHKIFDIENQKGVYLEGLFFPDIAHLSQKIKVTKKSFKRLKKRLDNQRISQEKYDDIILRLNNKKDFLINERENKKTEYFENLVADFHNNPFRFNLRIGGQYNSKYVYVIDNSPLSFFIMKQLQINIRKSFNKKPQNKNTIISQIKSLLDNNFPKYIIKTDIRNFYESINTKLLKEKIYDNSLISLNTRKLLQQIINEYQKISNSTDGIPRGIGVSAYLAEIYLKDFDESIQLMEDVIYYARYVDDIFIIFSPKGTSDTSKYLPKIENLLNKLSLTTNKEAEKTIEIDLTQSNKMINFMYLGYNFDIKNSKLFSITPTQKRINRIKQKIEYSLNDFKNNGYKKNQDLLIDRLRFLTGNIKLFNSKRAIFIGIYYSNIFCTKYNFLSELDHYTKHQIDIKINDAKLKRRLLKITFKDGYETRKIRNFSTKRISEITKAWKNV